MESKNKILYIGGAAILAGVVYMAFFWTPNVVVKSVDYKKGIAVVTINGGGEQTLYAGSTLKCGFGYGVKFSPHSNKNSPSFIPRIELVKSHFVVKYLNVEQIA